MFLIEPINFDSWVIHEQFDIFTAAALWCNKNPFYLAEWSLQDRLEVFTLIIHLFKHQLDAENYPIDKRNTVLKIVGEQLDNLSFEYVKQIVLNRSQLKDIAIKFGARPTFLFHNKLEIEVESDLLKLNVNVNRLGSESSYDEAVDTKKTNARTPIRLEKLKEFITFLKVAAKAKGVEFDPLDLPMTKAQVLAELQSRHKNHFKIKIDAFELVWKEAVNAEICANSRAKTEIGETFLRQLF